MRNLERTKNYQKWKENVKPVGDYKKLANRAIRMIKKEIRIIKIDQCYTSNSNANISIISKNNINTYKQSEVFKNGPRKTCGKQPLKRQK